MKQGLELYEEQRQFVKDARSVIDDGGVGVFSSPTGTGKTRSLLVAVSEYVDNIERYGKSTEDVYMDARNRMLEKALLHESSGAKVLYCTRTHKQLMQAIKEAKTIGLECNSVVLGSRRVYCVNPDVNELSSIEMMNEKCKQLISTNGCVFYDGSGNLNGCGAIDIEEMIVMGKKQRFCPYYASKRYSMQCEIVFLPYQLLFTREGRRSVDINVADKVVIVDEAHNICDAVAEMNSACVYFDAILECISVFGVYKQRWPGKSRHSDVANKVNGILVKIAGFRSKYRRLDADEDVALGVSEFLIMAGIEEVNMLEVEEDLMDAGVIKRIEMIKKKAGVYAIEISKLLRLLTMSDVNGRIFYSTRRIRFVPIDPSIYFEGVSGCKALLLAGGTMEPIEQLQRIFGGVNNNNIQKLGNNECEHYLSNNYSAFNSSMKYFSYKSICEDFLPLIVCTGPSGKNMIVNYETRENHECVKDVVQSILNLSNAVREGGIVCFVPSKAYLEVLKHKIGDKIGAKRVFYEYDECVFDLYTHEVRKCSCILLAVVGGGLSEGINFNDELCRMVVVIGVPYPVMNAEMKERALFYGTKHISHVAMKAVNQALGRALRHKNDYAVLVLLDKRYIELSYMISPWIKQKIIKCDFRHALVNAYQFLRKQR
ncbi:DEAD H (Asp-Glu-Ala-Asp His) box helicase 11 [Ordospora colligata]|uniref:ATP-dependent DNA helicase CHL1 n=1 Tax=Ordospora colligata OC4 TaxID=1354746 RepID=A0A0B2UIX6_9MICR|nr:Rad3-like DNA helicase [Ordospora colligata OC4]KHN69184.1 Rad3-like DNA helicase [Ordospora colligata OC4]TBU14462.1 Rad3-like DNA helicase [Ordospora colligata]TBU14639.1 Rad3-like DNA helicase [Ordospora colligata]